MSVTEAHKPSRPELAIGETEVLICDDDPQVGRMLADVLNGAGYATTTLRRGWDAISRLTETDVHIAVVDKNLPDISGLEVIRLGLQASPDTVFIIVTAYSSMETAMEAMDLGAAAYVSKPFDLPVFLDRMDLARLRASRNRLIQRTIADPREEPGRAAPAAWPQDSLPPPAPAASVAADSSGKVKEMLVSLKGAILEGKMDRREIAGVLSRAIETLETPHREAPPAAQRTRSPVPSFEKGT